MDERRKIYWATGGFAVFFVTLIFIAYYFSYTVKADFSNFEEAIGDYYNRGYSNKYSPDITVHESVIIGKNSYLLMNINESLGSAVLLENITGRHRIESLSYGSGNFKDQIIESEGEKYLLYAGRNTKLEIASMVFSLDGYTYTIDIPQKTEFLVHKKIDSRIDDVHLDLDNLKLYNSVGIDITDQFDLSGGGI